GEFEARGGSNAAEYCNRSSNKEIARRWVSPKGRAAFGLRLCATRLTYHCGYAAPRGTLARTKTASGKLVINSVTEPKHQTTILEEVALEGVGLHTGGKVHLTFRPSLANAGIRFFRTDIAGHPAIPARVEFVSTTLRGTTLELHGVKIYTVEHLLSAAAGLGVDNLDVLLDAAEPPAMDGSSLAFAQALLKAGIQELAENPKRQLRIPEETCYSSGDSSYRAIPWQRFEISVTYQYDHPLVGKQSFELVPSPEIYLSEVAGARTFCFEEEVEQIKKQGLGRGGSLENTVVIGKDKVHSSSGGLRFPNEPVRHKVLDMMGDLALMSRCLNTVRIEAIRPGHLHNIQFAKILSHAARKMRMKEEVL
ncbi:MAG: UDP-3-O-[3-hydroxymyristoyl] N-acetylglucosamine deacetylase, partial [Elusimicrobia bacterium]|nr:UDP-3-O-[3-hydroxymyristoyl] N-acetylglucosamine deacetylase [Elusimicrobiota bacterium]